MVSLFKRIKKTLDFSSVVIDSGVFILHYGVTVLILMTFAFLIIGRIDTEPVTCFKQNDIPPKFLDAFCWMRLRFNGFGTQSPVDKNPNTEQTKIFQGTDVILFLCLIVQAVVFLVPRYFWKFKESGRLEELLSVLNCNRYKKAVNLKNLANTILVGTSKNRNYFRNYLFAEILNACNVTVSLILLEIFLGIPSGTAVDVIELADGDWSLCWKLHCDNSKVVRQQFTKSIVHHYNSFGDVEGRDAIVMLPINIIYEKIYIFLWGWFFILCILSYMSVVYRIILVLFPALQVKILKMRCTHANVNDLVLVRRELRTGNWFLLYLLSKNIDSKIFADLMVILAKIIRGELTEVNSEL